MPGPSYPSNDLRLHDGARVAVVGGGPAGSFFATFLLDMAARIERQIHVDLFEPRDFRQLAPKGCNMCGGIISESLVQHLAAEGIQLGDDIVQRGIESYVLHMDVGSARIDTPLMEKRIAAVFRGAGPRDGREIEFKSFDGDLLQRAFRKGATIYEQRVDHISLEDGRPVVGTKTRAPEAYDLVAMAVGVNTPALKLVEELGIGFKPPRKTKTFIREYFLGKEVIDRVVGNAMHVFLLDIPRLEFAALIPKGSYATVCLLGERIDKYLVEAFFASPEVKRCLPPDWQPEERSCQCFPSINIVEAQPAWADRMVFLGDCGVTRLYKDGIGGAYRAAKAAASTAIFHGVAARDFKRHYGPVCRHITRDNRIGKMMFGATGLIQKAPRIRTAMRNMVIDEQGRPGPDRRLSQVLWDLFTGSETYRNILLRALHPALILGFIKRLLVLGSARRQAETREGDEMTRGKLGNIYEDGDVIIQQGDAGDSMYVIQEGKVQVFVTEGDREVPLRTLNEGEIFGEMALFDREKRSASVRALGKARVLSVERKSLLKRFQQDPTLALKIVDTLSQRVRQLSSELARNKQ